MVTESELREQLEDALEDILCFCGNYKRIGKPFCFRCWDLLPKNFRLVHGWIIAVHQYDSAKEWLKKQFTKKSYPTSIL